MRKPKKVTNNKYLHRCNLAVVWLVVFLPEVVQQAFEFNLSFFPNNWINLRFLLFGWIITNYFLIVRSRLFWFLGFVFNRVPAGWPNWDVLSCIRFCESQVWWSHWQWHALLLLLDFFCIKLDNSLNRLNRSSSILITYDLILSYILNFLFLFIIRNALKSGLRFRFRLRLCVCLKFWCCIWLCLWLGSEINFISILFLFCGFNLSF